MALQLNSSFETPHGLTVDSTYWRWVGLAIEVPASQARCVLYAYASPEAFAAGKQPIGQREYVVKEQDFATLATQLEGAGSGLSAIIYQHAKAADPFFADAVEA